MMESLSFRGCHSAADARSKMEGFVDNGDAYLSHSSVTGNASMNPWPTRLLPAAGVLAAWPTLAECFTKDGNKPVQLPLLPGVADQ